MPLPSVQTETGHRAPWWLWIAAGVLLAVSTGGADFGQYSQWATAVLERNIFALPGDVQSPGGVPFSLGSPTPGVMFALSALAFNGVLDPFIAALVAGWLAAIAFWCSAFAVLRRVVDGDRTLLLFGAGVLFLGTHSGFYSQYYSTEVFAMAFVAGLWALAWRRRPWTLVDCVAAGSLTALLILVRPFLAVYALPCLWLGLASRQGDDDGRIVPGIDAWKATLVRLLMVGAPILFAVAQLAVVNRWMTGSPLQSPYTFGGAGFRSLDLADPELLAVLTHSWHGLLSYHPLYGVAFLALLVNIWRSDRILWGTTLAAVLVHLWVQSGWYVWWLGTDTFGMRGMAPAALPIVTALVVTIRQSARTNPFAAALWTGATLLACAWSTSLLIAGRTQFLTWTELLTSEHHRTTALLAGMVIGMWALRHIGPAAPARPTGAEPARAVHSADAALLAGLTFGYLLLQLLVLDESENRALRAVLGVAGMAMLAGVTWLARWTGRNERLPAVLPVLRRLALPVIAIALLCLQIVLFAGLAIPTERHLASGAPPPRQFRQVSASPVSEVEDSYAEYLLVAGFDDKKAAIRGFLREQGVERPDDGFLVSRIKEVLAADALVGGVPIEVASRNGVVQLVSDQTSAEHRARAVELTSGVAGVRSVEDRMR